MFCTVKGHENLGIAKILESSGNKSIIEYFDAPEKPRSIHTIANSQIVKKVLGQNCRIYYNHPQTSQWVVGRVLQDYGNKVEIRFVDYQDELLDYEHLFVRWHKPISDPTAYLANLITETPQYAQARSLFLDSYIKQRGSAWGLSGLMSSVIELEPHQINVVRRVLNDASQRYLLADEVGLGKTIEAGVIIRQAVLDDPYGHRVVILVPSSLVQQWRQELIHRFGLEDYLDDSIFVISQDFSEELSEKLRDANMLVIDEAHHLVSTGDKKIERLYELISDNSNIERFLLLSATPVIRNEKGFLRMLHLLDPVIYSLSDETFFHHKIQNRQTLAETVAMLDPQNVLYLDSVLTDLLNILPDDLRLAEIVRTLQTLLIGLPDEEDPELCEAIRLVRAHLSETYRLHRRIMRNRRKNVSGLTPERKGSLLWIAKGSQMQRTESILEAWRINASVSYDTNGNKEGKRALEEFYWKAVSALLENPDSLHALCQTRLKNIPQISNSNSFSHNKEVSLLEGIIAQTDFEEWLNNRLNYLSVGIKKLLASPEKIVVFCSSTEIANKVFQHLKSIDNLNVIRHEVIQDDFESNNEATAKFLSDKSIKVIVCDYTAEEGINLQGGQKTVIHFDLLIEPNRIEQRMGRVDRYGSGPPVQSIVLVDESSKYQKVWYDILAEALGVFDRSISSLQYLIEEELLQLRTNLFDNGIEALSDLHSKLSGSSGMVAKELKLIDQQDSLDELSPLSEWDTEAILDADSEWKEIRDSFFAWVVDSLMFNKIREHIPAAQNSIDPPFRFQYRTPGEGGVATLIPLSKFMDDFLGVIDFGPRRSTSRTPLTYSHATHRVTAVKRGVRILRYGDEFIEAVKSFSDIDDRGRSYAMWRQFYNGLDNDDPQICFRFDFLIESRLDDAANVLKDSSLKNNQSARSAISRRGDALFPPCVEHVWINEEGEELDQAFIEKYLSQPYAKEEVVGHYIDKNIKSYRFLILKKMMPDKFANWNHFCARLRNKAFSILDQRKEIAERKYTAIKRAQVEDEVRHAQLMARIQHLQGKEAESEKAQLELEKKINNALYRGIQEPSIKVDVAGVVFLSNQPFPNIEQAAKDKI